MGGRVVDIMKTRTARSPGLLLHNYAVRQNWHAPELSFASTAYYDCLTRNQLFGLLYCGRLEMKKDTYLRPITYTE